MTFSVIFDIPSKDGPFFIDFDDVFPIINIVNLAILFYILILKNLCAYVILHFVTLAWKYISENLL